MTTSRELAAGLARLADAPTLEQLDAWLVAHSRPRVEAMSSSQRSRCLVWLSEQANRARVRTGDRLDRSQRPVTMEP